MIQLGKIFILAGIVLAFLGTALALGISLPPLGKLPGDILIKRGAFTLYLPLTTSLLLSGILSLIYYFFRFLK
jgi:hypothetical protein